MKRLEIFPTPVGARNKSTANESEWQPHNGAIGMRYVAYAIDLTGVARAVYEIDCPSDEHAEERAKAFLRAHPAVEVWDGPRRVARLVREGAERTGEPN